MGDTREDAFRNHLNVSMVESVEFDYECFEMTMQMVSLQVKVTQVNICTSSVQ